MVCASIASCFLFKVFVEHQIPRLVGFCIIFLPNALGVFVSWGFVITQISNFIGYIATNGLKLWVTPIAKRPVFTMLASAEKYLASLFRCIFQRCKISAFVGSIAQRLLATFSTGAPKIRSTFFNFCWKRTFLRYDRSRHEILQELVIYRPSYWRFVTK